jgi:hypothetical protein
MPMKCVGKQHEFSRGEKSNQPGGMEMTIRRGPNSLPARNIFFDDVMVAPNMANKTDMQVRKLFLAIVYFFDFAIYLPLRIVRLPRNLFLAAV